MNTIIVVPCYNEAKRLPQQQFLDYVQQHEEVAFLFANDGSSDDTLKVLKSLTEKHERLLMMDIQPNGGKAEAVRRGVMHAAQHYDATYIGFWDADLATPLFEIGNFITWADKGFDMIMGLRLMRLGAKVRRKKLRHYLGRCFATCASMMLNLPVYDTQCGAKIFNRRVTEVLFSTPFITRWLFDVEILARYEKEFGAKDAERKIYELPLFQWEDVDGSRLKKSDFFRAPIELLKIRKAYMRKKVS